MLANSASSLPLLMGSATFPIVYREEGSWRGVGPLSSVILLSP